MKPSGTLTTLFKHHLWANLRLFEWCAGLTREQLDAAIPGTYGSIQDTLQHIVRAEKSYFSRISTGQLYRHPADAPPMSMAEMEHSIRMTGAGLVEWAPKVVAGDMVEIDWDGTLRQVPKAIILTQAINHATEHRAQIMVMMTQLGAEPPDISSWTYFDQKGE
mgnify:CR=1 FL=1